MKGPVARAELRLNVTLMRDLGVVEWAGIKLGPLEPRSERRADAGERDRETPEERQHRTLFAASQIRPTLPKRETRESAVPRAVVARRASAKAATDGRSKPNP